MQTVGPYYLLLKYQINIFFFWKNKWTLSPFLHKYIHIYIQIYINNHGTIYKTRVCEKQQNPLQIPLIQGHQTGS